MLINKAKNVNKILLLQIIIRDAVKTMPNLFATFVYF